MGHSNEEKLAALAYMMAEMMEMIVAHTMVDATGTKVVMLDDIEVTLGELIERTQVLAREVLSLNETVH